VLCVAIGQCGVDVDAVMLPRFIANQALSLLIPYSVAFACGAAVEAWSVRVNYTRKINHFVLFFLPLIVNAIVPIRIQGVYRLIATAVGVGALLMYIRPIRDNWRPAAIMFRSFDRPEDRPYPLLWLSLQAFGPW